MKPLPTFILFLLLPFIASSQCSVTINHNNASCFGGFDGSATAIPNGTSPFTYLWSPGNQITASITNQTTGTFTVTVTDANTCISTATVTITSPPALTSTITSVAPSCGSCCNGSATDIVSGGSGPYSYQWMPSGGTGNTATNLCAGTYTCCVIDANGCSTCNSGNCPSCETSVVLSPATGQIELSAKDEISVFPSPATDFVTVKETFSNTISTQIMVSNVLGETVYLKSIFTAELNENINISSFESGIYFISIKTPSGTSVTRFVKE